MKGVSNSPSASPRRILFFTCAAHAVTHLYMLLYAAMLRPMQESFGVDLRELTVYVSLSNVLFGLGALPAGWLSDRYGEKAMLVAFFLITAGGGILVGLAHGKVALAVGMIVLGAGCSIFHPVGNAMISKGIPDAGRAMGVNGLWGNVGTAAAPLVAASVALAFGWRTAYVALALPTALLGILLLRSSLQIEDGTSAAKEATRDARNSEATDAHRRPVRVVATDVGGSWKVFIAALLVAMTCGGFYFHLITTMLPTHLGEQLPDRVHGWIGSLIPASVHTRLTSEFDGALLASFVYAIGGAGQLFGGAIVRNRDARSPYLFVLMAAAVLVLSLAFASGWSLVALAAAMAIFVFAAQPIENVLLARYSPARSRGVLFGAKFILAFGVGGLGTLLAGHIERESGVAAVFSWAAAFTALAALAAFSVLFLFRRAGSVDGSKDPT